MPESSRSCRLAFAVPYVDRPPQDEEVTPPGVGKDVADDFSFEPDLANHGEIGEREDRDTLIRALRDQKAPPRTIHPEDLEVLRRGDLFPVEHDLPQDLSRGRVDRDDRLRLAEADVDRARGRRDPAGIARESPARDRAPVAGRQGAQVGRGGGAGNENEEECDEGAGGLSRRS